MRKQLEDLTGKRFGYYTVLEKCERKTNERLYWLCKCDCGTIKKVEHYNLIKGKIRSCGCFQKQDVSKRFSKHRKTNNRLFHVWVSMRGRCNNPKNTAYKNYGGRGIKVCKEWQDDFMNFYNWAIKNGYDENAEYSKCTLERLNVNGDYEPSNCTFKSAKEQANNRRSNILIEYKGEKHTLLEWCEILGLEYRTILNRYHVFVKNPTKDIKTLDDVFSSENYKENEQIRITYDNKTLTISEWSKLLNIRAKTMWDRYNKGMCAEDILYKGNLLYKRKLLSQERS